MYSEPGIAADGQRVYWTNAGGVVGVARGGGDLVVLAFVSQSPLYLAIDATHAYWLERGVPGVSKALLSGGDVDTLWRDTASDARLSGLAVGADAVFFGSDEGVMKLGLAGGVPSLFVKAPAPERIAVDTTWLYWAANGKIQRMPLAGGASAMIYAAPRAEPITRLVLAGTELLWVEGGRLMKMPASGGAVESLSFVAKVEDITADSDYIYCATDVVHKMPRNGDDKFIVVAKATARRIAIDDDFVYWLDSRSKSVFKVAK